jgi:hypothetical protein
MLLVLVVKPSCRHAGRTGRREGPRERRKEEEKRSCG